MAENQFPVELETYLADGQAKAREQEARMAESAARYEAMKRAKAAAEAEQAEHEDNIRNLLMDTNWNPEDDSTANYLHCIDDRLSAIGMILYDLVLAVRQKGA